MSKSKSNLPYGFKAEAERVAETYRAELSISKFSPLDAFKLAKHLGVKIYTVNEFLDDSESEKIIGSPDKPIEFSALWMRDIDGDNVIIHNPDHSPYRQQSDIMHELAHIIRKHEIPDEVKRLCILLNLRSYNSRQEDEAKHLGGCLQITRAALMWASKQHFSHEEIAEYYCASMDMVRYRIYATGVEKQRAYIDAKKP